MLLSKKGEAFVVKFIDYVAKVISVGEVDHAPVTASKLPGDLLSVIKGQYLQDPTGSPFFELKSSYKTAYHPLMAYTQIVVACMELFTCNAIHRTTLEDRLEAKRHMDEILSQVPELTRTPYFEKYYGVACKMVIQAQSFMQTS